MDIIHAECGKSWSGRSRAHCPACHRTFSTDTAADKHRIGRFGENRRCADPVTVGLVLRGDIWGYPSPLSGEVEWR